MKTNLYHFKKINMHLKGFKEREKMIVALRKKALTARSLQQVTGLSLSQVYRHLKYMESIDMVDKYGGCYSIT